MRKVLVGTPSHDGRLDVWYVNSLIRTIKAAPKDWQIDPVFLSFDSLIQRARNSLVEIALSQKYDDLFFIDSDTEWEPQNFFSLLECPEDVVGAALVKKSDTNESYTAKITNKSLKYNSGKNLISVDGIGTGFLKISAKALEEVWYHSLPYYRDENKKEERMIFDLSIKNGELISEDYIFCEKWTKLGHKVFMDPSFTINHVGSKKYTGDISSFMKNLGYK